MAGPKDLSNTVEDQAISLLIFLRWIFTPYNGRQTTTQPKRRSKMIKKIINGVLKIRAYMAVAAYKKKVNAQNRAWIQRHFK